MRLALARAALLTLAFGLLHGTACGSEQKEGSAAGETRRAIIGAGGGTLEASDGALRVTVPPGR
jgi:hypothetical protein